MQYQTCCSLSLLMVGTMVFLITYGGRVLSLDNGRLSRASTVAEI